MNPAGYNFYRPAHCSFFQFSKELHNAEKSSLCNALDIDLTSDIPSYYLIKPFIYALNISFKESKQNGLPCQKSRIKEIFYQLIEENRHIGAKENHEFKAKLQLLSPIQISKIFDSVYFMFMQNEQNSKAQKRFGNLLTEITDKDNFKLNNGEREIYMLNYSNHELVAARALCDLEAQKN